LQVVETLFDTFLIVMDSTSFQRGNTDFMSGIHLLNCIIIEAFVKVFPFDIAGN